MFLPSLIRTNMRECRCHWASLSADYTLPNCQKAAIHGCPLEALGLVRTMEVQPAPLNVRTFLREYKDCGMQMLCSLVISRSFY